MSELAKKDREIKTTTIAVFFMFKKVEIWISNC